MLLDCPLYQERLGRYTGQDVEGVANFEQQNFFKVEGAANFEQLNFEEVEGAANFEQ